MMHKIKTGIEWIKKNRLLSFLVLLSFLSYVYLYSRKQVDTNKELTPKSTPTSTITDNVNYKDDDNNIPKYNNKDEPFLMNTFETPERVIGYTWNDNKIIYASKSGIYELLDNKSIYKSNIESVFFSNNSSIAVIKDVSGYFLIDLSNQIKTPINIDSKTIMFDNNINNAMYTDKLGLKVQDLTNNSNILIKPDNDNYRYGWIYNRNKFFIFYPDTKSLEIYDISGQKTASFKIKDNYSFLSISPDINKVIASDENNIYIINLNNGNTLISPFKNTTEIKIDWISEDEFIVTEKEYLLNMQVYDQYLWIVNTAGKRTFFSNSIPITSKINIDKNILINRERTAVLTIDNTGSLWVYALKPSYIPTYTEDGVYLYKVPDVSREDSH